MSTKIEMNLYPQAYGLPGAPPNYNEATLPPQAAPMFVPQQPPYQPQPQQTVHIITVAPQLGPGPCRVTCPSCHQSQVTKTRYVSNTRTHIIALILFATTFCCCIPYMFNSCKSSEHSCSNCGAYLGKYDR